MEDLLVPQDFLDFLADLSGMEDGSIELPSRVPEGMIAFQMPPDFESLMEDVLPPVASTSFPAGIAPTGSLDLPHQLPNQSDPQGVPSLHSLAWSQPQAAVPHGVASVVERQPTASASSGKHRHARSHSSAHEAPGGPHYGLAPFAGTAQIPTEQPCLATESQTLRQWSGSRGGSDSEEEYLALSKMDKQARNRIAQRKCRARKRNKQAEVQAEMQGLRADIARLQGQNELLQQQAARLGRENIELLQENEQLRLGIARKQRQPVGTGSTAAAAAADAPQNAAEGPAAVDRGHENDMAGAEQKGVGTPSGFPTAMHSISPAMQAKLDAVLPRNTVVKMALCDDAGERISLSVDSIKSSTPGRMRETQMRYVKELANQLHIATMAGNPSAAAEAAQRVTALVMEAMLLWFCHAMYNARTYQIAKVAERIDPRHGPDFRGPLTFKEPNEPEIERMNAHMDALLNVTESQKQLLLQAWRDLYVKLLRLEADRADYLEKLEQACISDMRGAKHLAVQYLQQMDLLDQLGTSFRDAHEAVYDLATYVCLKVFTPRQCALVLWRWYPKNVDFLNYITYLARKSGEPPLAGADGKLTRRLNRSVEAALSAQVQALRPFPLRSGDGSWSQQAPIITINPRSTLNG